MSDYVLSSSLFFSLVRCLLFLCWCRRCDPTMAFFYPHPQKSHATLRRSRSLLFMGKGFNKAKNKQADLARKMQEAQKKQLQPTNNDDEQQQNHHQQQQKQKQKQKVRDKDELLKKERAEFEKLLDENPPPVEVKPRPQPATVIKQRKQPTSLLFGASASTKKAPNRSKVRAKDAKRKKRKGSKEAQNEIMTLEEEKARVLQEGDTAERRHFESLVSVETSKPLGAIEAAKLVPWVPPFLQNYLVVVADPRKHSADLRQTVPYLASNLNPTVLSQIIVISADSVGDTVSWMRRADINKEDTPIRMFSDERLVWMRKYSAVVNDDRWSMSLFLFCTNGTLQKLVRQVDPSKASQLVMDMVGDDDDDDDDDDYVNKRKQ